MPISYGPLRELMRQHNISYRTLRAEIGIHSTYTTYLKNDTGYVSLATIDALCQYFDVDISQIATYYDAH